MADPVTLGITLALNLAAMAMTASKHIEGPRLTDLSASTAAYGTPLTQFYGTKRLELPCIFAENIKEVKSEQKTKGGKYTEYTYYGTWASFIADNPIDRVLMVWADRHLVMDVTGTGGPITPILSGPSGLVLGDKTGNEHFRIYLGTETQHPDPRMKVTIEAKEGPGTCPGYLGISYIMFEDIPLHLFGNRLPQISCQATRNALVAYPYESHPTTMAYTAGYAAAGTWMILYSNGSGDPIEWWDLATRTTIGISHGSGVFSGSVWNVAVAPDGVAYMIGFQIGPFGVVQSGIYSCTPGSGYGFADTGAPWFSGPTRVLSHDDGSFEVYTGVPAGNNGYLLYGEPVPTGDTGRDFCRHGDDSHWGIFQPAGASSQIALVRLSDDFTILFNSVGSRSNPNSPTFTHVASEAHFYVISDGHWMLVSDDTSAVPGTIKASGVQASGATDNLQRDDPNATKWWSNTDQISLIDGSIVQSVNLASWVNEDAGGFGVFYDAANDALVSHPQFVQHLTWRFLNRATGGGWTLGEICADVADQCGMRTTDYNFTDLDQTVPGYAWTQGAGKDVIGALLDLYDSDIRPHGFIQQGLKRGGVYSSGTITTDWMVNDSRGQNGAQSPLYTIPITAETDLPLRVAATFSDTAMEEQPNTATAQRNAISTATSREQSFDLSTFSATSAFIQPYLERALRRFWVGSSKPSFLLTPLEIRTEPGDVRPLMLENGELLRIRATKITIRANRTVDASWEVDGETQVNPPEWQLDNASPLSVLYDTPGASSYGRPPDTIPAFGPTKGFVFDTPLLFDADDTATPFLYDAAGAYSSASWLGAVVWEAAAPTDPFMGNWDAFTSGEPSTWGTVTGTLPDATTDVIDRGTQLTVTVFGGGALSSITEDEMLGDQGKNLALIGGELVQFQSAQLIAANEYTLSGFVRGARNTEWATGAHATGEYFLMVGGRTHKRSVGAGEIGDASYYKFSPTGLNLTAAATLSVPKFQANAQRPPAPAHLTLHRDPATGDWSFSWVRRSRIGGGSVNGQDVPLGESSEAYRVKIMNGAAVIRTFNPVSPALVYTDAEQVADWGSAQTHLTVEVCQMSPTLSLEGFASTASA